MGQIKNIKLHIVTDIKYKHSTNTSKCGFPTLVNLDLVLVNVVCVQTNMVSFASTDSVFADSVSVSTPTTSDSGSSSSNNMEDGRWWKVEIEDHDHYCVIHNL